MPAFSFHNDSWKQFPSRYEKYFNDNFGLRNTLIFVNNFFKYGLFSISPVPRVLAGKNGWLFYADKDDGDPVACYRGTNLFSDTELYIIKKNIEGHRDFYKKFGIPLIILIVPNKHSIYPEYLPDNLKRVSKETRTDQFIKYLSISSDMMVLDLRKTLIEKKGRELLYQKTGTHWNSLGAFWGYKDLITAIGRFFPEINNKRLTDYNIEHEMVEGHDLANMLALKDLLKENEIIMSPKFKISARTSKRDLIINGKKVHLTISGTDDPGLPSAMMVHDSFGGGLQPYLSEHFSRIAYVPILDLNSEIIKKEKKPDIVIYEVAERYLYFFLPVQR